MSWILLTAISVLFLSVSILLQRVLLHTHKADPVAYAIVFQGIVAVLLGAFVTSYDFQLPNMHMLWLPALVSIVCFGIGHIVCAEALQRVEASVFSILFASHAVWVMLVGILLLNESLTELQMAGTVLVFVSIGLLVNNAHTLRFDRGVALGLLGGLLFGIALPAWSFVGRNTDTLSWSAVSFLGASLVALLMRPRAIYKMKPLFDKQMVAQLLLLGTFYAIGSVAMLFAYKQGTFSLVSPLRQTAIVVTVLLALAFLPEERNRIDAKLAAALMCFAGVIALVA